MTSSVQPPVLNPPIGTPSNEWAEKTTSSLDPPSQETPQNATSEQPTSQSPGVTPGNELPGAFPNRGQGETSTGSTNITETIVDTAKQYLPTSVMNTVGTLLGNNNNPSGTTGHDNEVRASEHDIYHQASLPSQELRGALPHEHVGGVGSLPGASIEKSVALLPDEQAEWSEWDTFAGRNTPGYQTPSNLKVNGTSLAQTVTQKAMKLDAQKAVGNIKPVAFDIKPAQDVSMPSTEKQGQQPGEHAGGAGSPPGSKDEQGVAILPEERVTKMDTDAVGGTTDPLKKETQSMRSLQRDEPAIQLEPRIHPLGGDASRWHGMNLGRGAMEEWERTAASTNDPPTETGTTPSEQRTTSSDPGQSSGAFQEPDNLGSAQRSAGSEGGTEGQHKATLKEKVTGGMKVVSGTLGRDKSKVEEGKKLMHGQVA